jgi:undecaprenyl pyrophosphate synthase
VLTKIQNPNFIPTKEDIEECEKINEHFGLSRFWLSFEGFNIGMNFIKEFKDFNLQMDENYLMVFCVVPLSEFKNDKKMKELKEQIRRIRNHPSFKKTIFVNAFTRRKEFLKLMQETIGNEKSISRIEDQFKAEFSEKDHYLNVIEDFDDSMSINEHIELVKKIFTKFKENSFDFSKITEPMMKKVLLLGTGEVGKSTIEHNHSTF